MCRPLLFLALTAALAAHAQTDKSAPKDRLYEYTADFSAGTVSAGGIVGLSQSAIEEVQSSQDLVVALKPLATGQSKSGYGIAISPFRSALLPMSGQDYLKDGFEGVKNRLLGQLTLSYADNGADLAGTKWRRWGFSADTSFYFNIKDDPVYYGAEAFKKCEARQKLEQKRAETLFADEKADVSDLDKKIIEAHKACIDNAKNSARWNADRIQLSAGGGRIRRDDGVGGDESLGTSFTAAGMFSAGKQGALQVVLRRTNGEVDLTTLGTASVAHKNSSLAALRYTYGSEDGNGDLKVLAEVSNAKDDEVTVTNAVYKGALGLDKKLMSGLWLQFRVGKNRTLDSTGTQTTALAQINFSPSAGLFK